MVQGRDTREYYHCIGKFRQYSAEYALTSANSIKVTRNEESFSTSFRFRIRNMVSRIERSFLMAGSSIKGYKQSGSSYRLLFIVNGTKISLAPVVDCPHQSEALLLDPTQVCSHTNTFDAYDVRASKSGKSCKALSLSSLSSLSFLSASWMRST